MEEKVGECVKDSLRKFIIYLMAFIRNLQYDSENTSKKYDDIDVNKDIKNFISQNSTNDVIPFKYEFMPYSSNIGKRYKNVSNNLIKEIRNFISTIFNNDIELQNFISLSNNKKSVNFQEMAEFIFRINNNKYADKELYYNEKVQYIFLWLRARLFYISNATNNMKFLRFKMRKLSCTNFLLHLYEIQHSNKHLNSEHLFFFCLFYNVLYFLSNLNLYFGHTELSQNRTNKTISME